jgi:hypothetical protein
MPEESVEQTSANSSVEILLAEHQRLSALYLHNADMGEKRTTAYLTLLSIGTALLVGLAQERFQKEFKTDLLLQMSLGFVIGVFIFGVITFRRLLERRIRAIEYLRAINRIHKFFVLKDPTIRDYFYWSACDDVPTFIARGAVLTGLRDVVAFFNSIFLGVAVGEIVQMASRYSYPSAAIISGILVGLVVLPLHFLYERRVLSVIEKKATEFVKFPKDKDPT